MARPPNASKTEFRAGAQQVETARKGGKASAAKRAERKTFREGLLFLLSQPIKGSDGRPSDKTTQDAIIAGLVKRAASGDPRAFELIRDTIGEKPAETVNVNAGALSALDAAFTAMAGDAK